MGAASSSSDNSLSRRDSTLSNRLFSSTSKNFSYYSYGSTGVGSSGSNKRNHRYSANNNRRSSSKLRHLFTLAPKFLSGGHHLSFLSSSSSKKRQNGRPWRNAGQGHPKSAKNDDIFNSWTDCAPSGASSLTSRSAKRLKSKNKEHRKIFREFLSTWKLRDLHCLVVEFDASAALRELKWRADRARCPTFSVSDDLKRLYDQKIITDTLLLYENQPFHVHYRFLTLRYPFFHRFSPEALWSGDKNDKNLATVTINSRDFNNFHLNPNEFALFLEFLYAGKQALSKKNLILDSNRCQIFDQFFNEFGPINSNLEEELRNFHQNIDFSEPDTVLIFTNSAASSYITNKLSENLIRNLPQDNDVAKNCRFKCHSYILAARSPFFRTLIEKRRTEAKKLSSNFIENFVLDIVLDESVIPRQYAPVILHAMYTDEVDLSLITPGCVSNTSCLTEVQAIASGKCQVSPVDEAMEVYQIAMFLEFGKLAQGSEDIIVNHITLDTLSSIYNWSVECYGSNYVRRHCINFLCQEFSSVANTIYLFDLEESLLLEALKSDFLQASELDILNAVIKWGEHQLVKRLEEREPNILIGTTHSISRKGVRRSDLSDVELREVLSNLTPFLRTDYLLPPAHPLFKNAQTRNLLSSRAVDDQNLGSCRSASECSERQKREFRGSKDCRVQSPPALEEGASAVALDPGQPPVVGPPSNDQSPRTFHRCSASSDYVRPRLFLPYYETARCLLEKLLSENPEQLTSLINLHPPISTNKRKPDVLFKEIAAAEFEDCSPSSSTYDPQYENEFTAPSIETIHAMKARTDEIFRQSRIVKRGLACGCIYHKRAVIKQVHLRIIREFGLSDCALNVLEDALKYWSQASLSDRASSQSRLLHQPEHHVDSSFYTPSLVGRRFYSEPHLTLSDASTSLSTEWPDLMVSSKAPNSSNEEYFGAACAQAGGSGVVWSTEESSPHFPPPLTTRTHSKLKQSQSSIFGVSFDDSSSSSPSYVKHFKEKATSSYSVVDLTSQINQLVQNCSKGSDV